MIDQVHPRDLPTWFATQGAGAQAVVLDVREPWELQTAPVPADGFSLVCISMRDVPQRLAELDASQPLAVLCHHGMRSLQVAAFLHKQGFERLANIAGGTEAWAGIDPRVNRY